MDFNTYMGIVRAFGPVLVFALSRYMDAGTAGDVATALSTIAAAGWSVWTNHPSLNEPS